MGGEKSPLGRYKLSAEQIKDGLDFFEEIGIIRQTTNGRYVLTETGERFFAILGCGEAKFSELCFQLFDSLVKSGKLKCRYDLKGKSYYFDKNEL